jgi:nucleotide-binding universal stress UspA family protein
MSSEPTKAGATEQSGSRARAAQGRAATVIVALDGSEHARAALPVARTLAAVEQATLHVLHIAERLLPPGELLHKLGLTINDIRGSIMGQTPGDPAEGIAQVARERQSLYIVLCTHTDIAKPAGELGRVARQVLLTAPCPVLLVPPARGLQPLALRQVLLPYDGTPTTAAAIGPALELADKAGAAVTVLHVATVRMRQPAEPGTIAVPRYLDQSHHEWPAWSHELRQRVCGLARAGQVHKLRLVLAAGEPEQEVARYTHEHPIDLIVLAWNGTLEVKRAAVAKAVIREASCPILVLRVHVGGTSG